MKMTLTMLTLTSYNNSVWDDFKAPEGCNRDELINYIIAETMELPLIYPDFDLMKLNIRNWVNIRFDSWARIWEALTAEYNPIENYNRYEDIKEDKNGRGSASSNGLTKVNSFNDGLADSSQVQNDSNGTSEENMVHVAHIHGNIGVTTTQAMINEEIQLRMNDFYTIVLEEFKARFCIRVW